MSSGVSIRLPAGQVVKVSTGTAPSIRIPAQQAPSIKMEFSQGIAGPRGEWEVDKSFRLRQEPLTIERGRVEIDFSEANTYYVLMTESIRKVVYTGLPEPGNSVRVQLYLEQDSVGGRTASGWPAGTQTPSGRIPILSAAPGALDSIVIDTFDGGVTSQLNIVGLGYLPLLAPLI